MKIRTLKTTVGAIGRRELAVVSVPTEGDFEFVGDTIRDAAGGTVDAVEVDSDLPASLLSERLT